MKCGGEKQGIVWITSCKKNILSLP